jgi:hypothetical protein
MVVCCPRGMTTGDVTGVQESDITMVSAAATDAVRLVATGSVAVAGVPVGSVACGVPVGAGNVVGVGVGGIVVGSGAAISVTIGGATVAVRGKGSPRGASGVASWARSPAGCRVASTHAVMRAMSVARRWTSRIRVLDLPSLEPGNAPLRCPTWKVYIW